MTKISPALRLRNLEIWLKMVVVSWKLQCFSDRVSVYFSYFSYLCWIILLHLSEFKGTAFLQVTVLHGQSDPAVEGGSTPSRIWHMVRAGSYLRQKSAKQASSQWLKSACLGYFKTIGCVKIWVWCWQTLELTTDLVLSEEVNHPGCCCGLKGCEHVFNFVVTPVLLFSRLYTFLQLLCSLASPII